MDALWQAVGRESFASSAQSNSARCRTCIEERSATCAVLPAKSCPGGLCSRSSIGTGYCHLIDLRCLHRTKRRRVKSENRRIEHAPGRMLSRTRSPHPGGTALLHAGAQHAPCACMHAPLHAHPGSPCTHCTTPERPAKRERTNLAHCCCVAASASLCAGTAHCPRTTMHNKAHGAVHSRLSVHCKPRPHSGRAKEKGSGGRNGRVHTYRQYKEVPEGPAPRARPHHAGCSPLMLSRGALLTTARPPGAEPVVGT